MRLIIRTLASAMLGVLIVAGPASATWFEGKVFCDDGDGVFDASDTPQDGVEVKAVSQVVSPGVICKDTTGDAIAGDAPCTVGGVTSVPTTIPVVAGYYRIMLPHIDNTYDVMLTGVGIPAGASVIRTSQGPGTTCEDVVIDVDTGNSANARKTCNFLLSPCVSPTTSTTSSTSTSSSSSSSVTPTTTSTSSTSSTSSSSSSSITTTSTSSTSSTSSSSSSSTTSTTSTTLGTTPLDICVDKLDHLKCYRTRRITAFSPNGVNLVDQFEDVDMTVLRPYRLCNPVDKNDEGINDPTEHQMCYQIRDTVGQPRFRHRDVRVENQFGIQTLVVTRPETLCVPAAKDGVPISPPIGDRMKCYRVNQKVGERDFVPINVTLEDQFESKETTVLKPVLPCNPTELDDAPINDPTCHQVCYRIIDVPGQPEFAPVPVTVEDEFYNLSLDPFRGECRQVSLLCVPSLKTEIP